MATAAIRCPFCGTWLRIAVQPSRITKQSDKSDDLFVMFDEQHVAHICKKEK